MEEEALDYDGGIKQRDTPQQMELIQQDTFFDVSALDAIRFSGEDCDKCVDALIYSVYVRNPHYGETMSNTIMQD